MPPRNAPPNTVGRRALLAGMGSLGAAGCTRLQVALGPLPNAAGLPPVLHGPTVNRFLEDVEARTFRYFWETTEARRGLAPDRYPTISFSSIAAMGFALTAFVIGVERGYVGRPEAAKRTLAMLRFLIGARQGEGAEGTAGYKGFFYHFLGSDNGLRFEKTELSTVDTALLIAGVLLVQAYFDGPLEGEIRTIADRLYRRVDWRWAMTRAPVVAYGWTPEAGFIPYDWVAYNEAMLVYILGLGSPVPAMALERSSWDAWSARLATFWTDSGDLSMLRFPPMFGHQYSHVWIDFRGIQDEFMRSKGIDYFENSRRATIAQRNYAMANPFGWRGYGRDEWGLTACDGPGNFNVDVLGEPRSFRSYTARGVGSFDDGTIAPTAAGGSMPFAPEICIPALMAMRTRHGDALYGAYGFYDAYNPTFDLDLRVIHGKVTPGRGWYDTDWIGIDQGPILAMIENYRTGLVWRIMQRSPYVRAGLERAGFSGGWLAA